MTRLFYNEANEAAKACGITNLRLHPFGRSSLRACPGCDTTANLELHNTHTAAYWMTCESEGCGWQFHDVRATGASESMAAHRASARRVFDGWNDRA